MANRKTHTSSAVKMRWMSENYKTYKISLRYDTDQELIDFVERFKAKNDGMGVSDIFRAGVEVLMEAERNSAGE
jgi:hypothetical protein